jgi:hypothetical protein
MLDIQADARASQVVIADKLINRRRHRHRKWERIRSAEVALIAETPVTNMRPLGGLRRLVHRRGPP